MPTEEEKDLMRCNLDAVRQGMPGFTSCQPQLRMMATAAHALAAIGDASARACRTKPELAGSMLLISSAVLA